MSLPQHRSADTKSSDSEEPYITAAQPLEGGHAVSPSDNENKEAHYYPNDVEAAPPLSEGSDEQEDSRFTRKFRSMRRSRGGVFVRDMFLILLLLGWWIPGIIREVSPSSP